MKRILRRNDPEPQVPSAILGLGLLAALGVVLLLIILLADFILLILAAIQSSSGTHYRYPFTLRLIR